MYRYNQAWKSAQTLQAGEGNICTYYDLQILIVLIRIINNNRYLPANIFQMEQL